MRIKHKIQTLRIFGSAGTAESIQEPNCGQTAFCQQTSYWFYVFQNTYSMNGKRNKMFSQTVLAVLSSTAVRSIITYDRAVVSV